jgi:DHA1 family bicyclomycin/chloramphenicol resistance-like MFS transporter
MMMRLRPDTFAMTAVLALLTALGPLSTDFYLPSLPDIARALRTDVAGSQATLSAFLVGFAVGQILYGPLSDRLGRRPVLLTGLAIFLAATIACAVSPTIEWLIGARFLQALGASGPIVLARAIVRDLYEGPRAGRELSRMGTIMGLVPAIAPVLGGVLHDFYGWRSTFLASLALGALLAAIVVLRLPETLRQREPSRLSIANILRGFRDLLRHRPYRAYIGLAALTYGGLFAFISGSSFVLMGHYGLSEIAYGFSFSFGVLGYITGTLIAQRIVGRFGLDGTIARGVACLAGGGALMLLLTLAGIGGSLAITVPMALYTAGVGLVLPQAQAAAMAPFGAKAGAASSLLGICQMTLAALIGLFVGQIVETAAWPLPLVILVIGTSAFALFHATRRARAI